MGDTDFQLVAVKEQVSQVRHHARWRRRSGSPHRENWADLRSAQRPAGPRAAHCRPPSRGAGMRPTALRTVSAIPTYGSRRTMGFPPRRNHLGTGGPSRRPPTAGCAGPHRENWPEVGVPLPARRSAWWHGRHAPVQRLRGAFCDSASAPEYEKSGRTVSALPIYGSRRTLGFPPRRNHLGTGGPSRRPPTAGCAGPHRENWPEVGVPLPARRSAWWHGRHAPVQRPRGAFCDSASAPEYEKSGRTVSALPIYGSRRTLGFPPRRNHLGTGGPSRRPPTAGCAGPHRENWPEVGVPLPARRSAWWHGRHAPVQRLRGAFCDSASAPEYEKSGRTVSALPMYGSRRTMGFPPRRNHLATGDPSRRPPTAGCADQRSAFPCLRVVPLGGLGTALEKGGQLPGDR